MGEPYFRWALDALDGLRWLVELDDWAFAGHRQNLGGRDPRLVDMAHVRWGTTSAVSALDLCAVELAYRYGEHDFWSEHAPGFEQVRAHFSGREAIQESATSLWLAQVADDPNVVLLRKVRNALTHRFLVRSAIISIRPPRDHEDRWQFAVDSDSRARDRPTARELVVLSRDCTERHLVSFGETFGDSRAPSPPRPRDIP